MASPDTAKAAAAVAAGDPRKSERPGGSFGTTDSTWRKQFKVHPAADVFPMMDDDELAKLGEDIKSHGLKVPIRCYVSAGKQVLIDGRNRLEAMERVGLSPKGCEVQQIARPANAVATIIGLNVHRRHLTKQMKADMIVAVHMAAAKARAEQKADRYLAKINLANVDEVSRGGRGKVDEVKAAAVADAERDGVSKRNIERFFAKAKGRTPKYTPRPIPKPRSGKPVVGLDAARRHYLDRCADPDVDLGEEQREIIEAFKDIAGKRLAARVKGGGDV